MITMIARAERGNQARRAPAAAAGGSKEVDEECEGDAAFRTKIATSARRSLLAV